MSKVKTALKVVAGVLAFGLWVVACPDVETYRDNGRCFETVKYAALFATVREVPC